MGTWFDRSVMKGLLKASTLGIHLVISTFIGFGIGYFLDIWLHTDPWLKIVFFCLGVPGSGTSSASQGCRTTVNLKKIYRNSAIGTLIFAAVTAFTGDWRFPVGVIAGGLLGMLNLRGMARGLEALTQEADPKARIMARSFVRLLALGAAIVVLALSHAVNLVGLLIGFTVVLTCTVSEGFFSTRRGGA